MGEVGCAKSGVGFPDAEQGGVEGIPFYKVSDMNIEGNEHELVVANNYVTQEQIDRKKWNVICDVPAIFFAKVGAAVMLNRKRLVRFPFLLDNNTMAYIFDKNIWDCDFGKTLFETVDLTRLTQVGALPSYNASDVENVEISIPQRAEQEKIGEYFKSLDRLITLHQRKCEQAKKLKKYMLQKMFPKKGESVPEIRFVGFTDAWEQRKFGELVEKYEDPVETPTDGYMRLGIRSHAKGTFHSYVEKGKELETAKMFKVVANNFIVNITFGWEHAVAITDENDEGMLVSHRFPQFSFKENMIPKFFRYLILDECFRHHLELSSPGGAGRNRVLKLDDMLDYKMKFPCSQEQEKIADYFDTLDRLITLHQRKCLDILSNFKVFHLLTRIMT